MRARWMALGIAAIAILAATWGLGVRARVTVAHWLPVHVLRLPPVPKHLYPRLRTGGMWSGGVYPLGIDGQGDVLAATDSASCCTAVIRYSLGSERWLPGWVGAGESGPIAAPAGPDWIWGAHSGETWADRISFSTRGGAIGAGVATGARPGEWWSIGQPAVDRRGNGWIGGWIIGSYQATGRSFLCPATGPGLPHCTPSGWAALGYAPLGSKKLRRIRIPAPAPITSVAVGSNGTVWALDPYRRCIKRLRGVWCRSPRLIAYQPKTHRFRTLLIAGKASSRVFASAYSGGYVADTIVGIASDGSVWMAATDFGAVATVIRLRHNRFSWFRVRLSAQVGPVLDASGNLWFCGRRSISEVDGKTGSVRRARLAGGSLLADTDGHIWYVIPHAVSIPEPVCY